MSEKYRDKRTAKFAAGERVKEFQSFERQAYKRLEILEAAPTKEALMLLPSNRFEALGGDRQGQYSIRINDKWRISWGMTKGIRVKLCNASEEKRSKKNRVERVHPKTKNVT